jgi:ribosome-binding protein aMBF1 (putative translation factor)
MLRRREALGIDKKLLAKKMKVPAIRITEIERGDKKMDADVLVKLFWELHLSFELTEKPIRRGPR